MASGVDRSEFSGPPKRRKLEDDEFGPSTKVKILESDVGPSISASSEDLEGSLGDNNGFSVSNESSKPVSGANSSNTSPTGSSSDDTGFPLDTADEKDEVSSTVSNLSDISGISMLSDDDDGSEEYNQASNWVRQQIHLRTDPRAVLKHLCSEHTQIPEEVDDLTLWRIVINMMSEPPKRQKLPDVNTVEDVVELINKSKNIIVLTGAGVSVSCGIPDFRSRDGIYSRLAQDFPDLPDPQAMFDINYFSQDPRPFYKFAREIYPGQFKPSPCHEFIKMLEDQGKLLRNYSQNIDTLERVCGIKNVIECHGSFATASCTKCKHQVPSDDIKQDIFSQTIPMCCKCQEQSLPPMTESSSNPNDNFKDLVAQGVMKPDIVFFGEGLPDAFHEAMANDKDVCDLLIVMGSSLKVRPVALIPSSIPSHVPQILINRESLPHLEFDVELLGDGDVVINQICHMLAGNFKKVCWRDTILEEIQRLPVHPQSPMNNDWEHSQDGIEDQEAYKFLNLLETNSKTKKEDLDENINEDNTTVQDGELRKKISDPENQNSTLCQKFLPGSSKVDHFSEISKKREHDVPDSYNGHDKSVTREGSFKKLKSDSDEQNYSESEPNLSTKFYANINHYLEKQTNSMDVDVSNNTNSKYDESLSKHHTSRKQKESCTKKDSENIGNNTLDDRPERTDVSIRKNEENNECSSLLQTDCMDVRNLSFHSQVTEHTVKNFQFIEKSRDRQFNSLNFVNNLNSDIENIPKTLDSHRGKSMTLSSSGSPTTSNESSSRTTEEIYISEDCHVVPRIDCLRDDPILDENLILSKSTDKMDLKPRHASIDSVMDSALGDSCSSSDCQKRKNDEDNTEDNTDDEGRWKSLLENFPSTESNSYVSLPDNSFYKLKPGKYIFPGAEICSNFTRNESGGLRSGSTTVQLCEQ